MPPECLKSCLTYCQNPCLSLPISLVTMTLGWPSAATLCMKRRTPHRSRASGKHREYTPTIQVRLPTMQPLDFLTISCWQPVISPPWQPYSPVKMVRYSPNSSPLK